MSTVFEQVQIKSEQLERVTPIEDMSCNQNDMALRNETSIIQTNFEQKLQTTQEQDFKNTVRLNAERMITTNDTTASLQQKFPNATPFEFEFLLFLRSTSR